LGADSDGGSGDFNENGGAQELEIANTIVSPSPRKTQSLDADNEIDITDENPVAERSSSGDENVEVNDTPVTKREESLQDVDIGPPEQSPADDGIGR